MKRYNYLPLALLFALTFSACTLDEEPPAPTNANNETTPVFLSTELTAITHDTLRAKATLGSLGNLTILRHGWVWSQNHGPTLEDSKLESGALGINDSFEMLIPGLTLGTTYHFRPFVSTGSDTTYGLEKTIFMGIPKLDDIALVADSACFLRVQGSLQSPAPPVEYGIVFLIGAGTPTLQQKSGQVQGSSLNNGIFQTDLAMLTPNTAYSIRAYAKSASGTGYSRVLPVTTPSSALVAANFSLDSVDAILFQGATVHFINSSIGATAYAWSFGDGATSADTSPVHTFDTKGNMTVRLTAKNGGCILTKDTVLTIIDDPFKDYWVQVEGGTFMMGCTAEQEPCGSNELPVHAVTLSSFFIGKTEVTQGQWQAVLGNNPSYFYACGPDCPVETVDWDRIVSEFIPALNRKTGRKHRLPTEAEWEFAARGGNASKGYRFAGGDILNVVAWTGDNSNLTTHPVGTKKANELVLYDISGNVWEWCNDYYETTYYQSSPANDPTGPASGNFRVLRGGSWLFTNGPYFRPAYRFHDYPYYRGSDVGFRLARY